MDLNYAKYLLKKNQENYNLIAKNFSRRREKPWSEAKFLVSDYVSFKEKILDLGCGSGQWLEFFKEKEAEYVGVDFSEKLIEIARSRYPEADFKITDVLTLPFLDNYFDKVYAVALFHNLPSNEIRKAALMEIKRVLKEKGFLILTCWDLWQNYKTRKLIYKFILLKIFARSKLDFKDILMDWQGGKGMKDCYFHCFTKRELRELIKSVGFKIVKEGKFLVGLARKGSPDSNFYLVAEK